MLFVARQLTVYENKVRSVRLAPVLPSNYSFINARNEVAAG